MNPQPDAIAPAIQSVLDLYASELSHLHFPDIDADTLAEHARKVRDEAATVAAAEVALESARAGLEARKEALLARAHRALAYARVFAEDEPQLAARLDAIALPRTRRGREGAPGHNGQNGQSSRDGEAGLSTTPNTDSGRAPRRRARGGETPSPLFTSGEAPLEATSAA